MGAYNVAYFMMLENNKGRQPMSRSLPHEAQEITK
jgi:hypothetical protein